MLILPSNARCRHPGTEKSLCWSAIVLALTPCSMFESPNWCLWPVMRACQRVCPAVRRSIASAMVPAAPTEKGIPSQHIIILCLQLLFRRVLLRATGNHLHSRQQPCLLVDKPFLNSSTTISLKKIVLICDKKARERKDKKQGRGRTARTFWREDGEWRRAVSYYEGLAVWC